MMHLATTLSPPYDFRCCRALGGETPGVLGAGLEELFRFVPSLRPEGVDVVVNIFRAICILGGEGVLKCKGVQHVVRAFPFPVR